eukprot:TRINITY_DN32757_c0_g1_i1.p1 TRINITY_DN32757_c0_g1~~TRINITY_DN32757_c0_g1_i1.p1  ORF type:complete len:362 (+),score=49.84 TRINITY_DN32757_c0_g1_i1:55-1086(+)
MAAAEASKRTMLEGYLLTVLIAVVNLVCLVMTQALSSSSAIPGYTQNLVMSLTGAAVLGCATLVRRESLSVKGDAVYACLKFGTASWFFQWGYTKCLIYLDPLQYTASDVAIGPVVSVMFGYAFLAEGLGTYKFFVMLRNVVVVALILDQGAKGLGIAGSSEMALGLLWAIVAFCGTSGMRIVQRTSTGMTPEKLAFWGYVMNSALWFPPGSIPAPRCRVPFLWPEVPEDKHGIADVPLMTWLALVVSGVFGTLVIVIQGQVLKRLDVGTYSITVAPLVLLSSTVYDMFQNCPGPPVFIGLALAGLGFALDMYRENRQKQQVRTLEQTVEQSLCSVGEGACSA